MSRPSGMHKYSDPDEINSKERRRIRKLIAKDLQNTLLHSDYEEYLRSTAANDLEFEDALESPVFREDYEVLDKDEYNPVWTPAPLRNSSGFEIAEKGWKDPSLSKAALFAKGLKFVTGNPLTAITSKYTGYNAVNEGVFRDKGIPRSGNPYGAMNLTYGRDNTADIAANLYRGGYGNVARAQHVGSEGVIYLQSRRKRRSRRRTTRRRRARSRR